MFNNMNESALRWLFWAFLAFSHTALTQDVSCTTCHREYTAASVHAALNQNCATCHGEGTEHVARPSAGGVIGFKYEPAKARAAACTGCHSAVHSPGISAHEQAGLACNDCHAIHDDRSDSSAALEPAGFERIDAGSQACIGCHEEVFSEFNFNERHRLQENTLTCASCHDPHGPSLQARLGGARDSRCSECHAAKDGPFVFEHAASRVEGCTACHAPHGTPNRHLLAYQQVGELCYSCHAVVPQFHLGFAPVGSPRFGTDTVCTNCHVTIHGSNIDRNFLK